MAVNVAFPEDVEMVSPGDKLKISYKLEKPLPIEKGMNFILREGGKTVAVGEITNVPGDSEADMRGDKDQKKKKRR